MNQMYVKFWSDSSLSGSSSSGSLNVTLLGSPNIWSFEDQLWGQGFVNNQKKNNWNYIFPKLATNMPQYTTFHWLCVTKNIAKYKQF